MFYFGLNELSCAQWVLFKFPVKLATIIINLSTYFDFFKLGSHYFFRLPTLPWKNVLHGTPSIRFLPLQSLWTFHPEKRVIYYLWYSLSSIFADPKKTSPWKATHRLKYSCHFLECKISPGPIKSFFLGNLCLAWLSWVLLHLICYGGKYNQSKEISLSTA